MSRTSCKNCANPISPKAKHCMMCGHPTPNAKNLSFAQSIIGLALGVCIVWYWAGGSLPFSLPGFGPSIDSVSETVKASMQEKFNSDSQFKQFHLKVNSVLVARQTSTQFQGIADITYEGSSHQVSVAITADRGRVIWKTESGAFLFVAQREIEKLGNSLQ